MDNFLDIVLFKDFNVRYIYTKKNESCDYTYDNIFLLIDSNCLDFLR